MSKKVVLKMTFTSDSDKTRILKSVTKVNGITSLSFDDEKGTLTVVGNVDPVWVVKRLRKRKWKVDIVTVGPAKEEEKEKEEEEKKKQKVEEKKEEEKKKVMELPPPPPPHPYYCGPPISSGHNQPVVLLYDQPSTNLCPFL